MFGTVWIDSLENLNLSCRKLDLSEVANRAQSPTENQKRMERNYDRCFVAIAGQSRAFTWSKERAKLNAVGNGGGSDQVVFTVDDWRDVQQTRIRQLLNLFEN